MWSRRLREHLARKESSFIPSGMDSVHCLSHTVLWAESSWEGFDVGRNSSVPECLLFSLVLIVWYGKKSSYKCLGSRKNISMKMEINRYININWLRSEDLCLYFSLKLWHEFGLGLPTITLWNLFELSLIFNTGVKLWCDFLSFGTDWTIFLYLAILHVLFSSFSFAWKQSNFVCA